MMPTQGRGIAGCRECVVLGCGWKGVVPKGACGGTSPTALVRLGTWDQMDPPQLSHITPKAMIPQPDP